MSRDTKTAFAIGLTAMLAVPAAQAQETAADASKDTGAEATADGETMSLEGGQDSTMLDSMTIEGEDRIRIAFERPVLDVQVEALEVGGLEWIDPASVVNREQVNLYEPYRQASAAHRTHYGARPWLMRFPEGPVARFRPQVDDVERWTFLVADSRGETVARFGGQGEPPKELAWDGMTLAGQPAMPGLTFSHALEAYDEAGNKRSFVGEGFELPPYVVDEKGRFAVLIPGSEVSELLAPRGTAEVPALVLEAATRINDTGRTKAPITVRATGRTFDQANRLAQAMSEQMADLLVGDPIRIKPVADVKPDSPAAGAVSIVIEG